MPPAVSPTLLTLTRHRGNLPVMAGLHAGAGTFGELVEQTALSRDTLSRSLRELGRPGRCCWVRRYRTAPPWRLTVAGQQVAPACVRVLDRMADQEAGVKDLLLRRWSLPIAASLQNWTLHFGELRAMLPDITPRALALALKDMQSAGLVLREVDMTQFPPSPVYRLSPAGATFVPLLIEVGAGPP
ncbi:MAG: winged helix-turn-helix transcriptional regulator [Planctomycetota bacterium]